MALAKLAFQDGVEQPGLAQASLNYQHALRAFFRRRVAPHDVDDLVQEVLLRLHSRRGGEIVSNLNSFIFQTATNVLHDRRRRDTVRHRKAHCELEPIHHPVDDLSPDRVLQAKEQASVALAALASMPSRTRAAFMLVRFESLSYKATAAQLGISVSAVEKHVTKALRIVTSRLQESDERQPTQSWNAR
ncbi:RNA polymerase sigma factor [Caulobacter sp. NIBR2454]|uniref:RNA polymerase sigma factor n=1 Tax=Caulobacter sp. NIBR2454 TaxID=3015996 RepID=UPI0022B7460B|nr:RNA polymerase sigma factor [Caulobacter sp. NIBR2454]